MRLPHNEVNAARARLIPVSDVELADLLRDVWRTLRRRTAALAEPHGLTVHQYRALRLVERGAPDACGTQSLRLSDLAERLRVVARSATDVVDDLERKGLVARAPHPTDRRSTVIELTSAGSRVLAELETARQSDAARYFAPLTAKERAELARLLGRLDGSC